MQYSHDDRSFDEFVRVEIRNLLNHVLQAGASRPEADDAVQEALAEAYAQWSTIRFPRRWVQRVSLRHHVRTRQRDRERPTREVNAVPASRATSAADAEFLRVEEEAAVVRVIADLPRAQGRTLALCYDGYQTAEIAKILEVSEATVRSHLRYARAALKRAGISDEDGILDPQGGAA
jgi:RNA polymerase sigma factor (sigma-70 family)